MSKSKQTYIRHHSSPDSISTTNYTHSTNPTSIPQIPHQLDMYTRTQTISNMTKQTQTTILQFFSSQGDSGSQSNPAISPLQKESPLNPLQIPNADTLFPNINNSNSLCSNNSHSQGPTGKELQPRLSHPCHQPRTPLNSELNHEEFYPPTLSTANHKSGRGSKTHLRKINT